MPNFSKHLMVRAGSAWFGSAVCIPILSHHVTKSSADSGKWPSVNHAVVEFSMVLAKKTLRFSPFSDGKTLQDC
jgi:hypothetical protein